jgi:quercetin dioxygenase-like cupin family protein
MKQVMAVLAALCALAQPLAAQEAHTTHAAGAKFEAFPNVPDCMKGAVLRGDPAAGPSIILIRGAAGCRIPRHWHTPSETILFVSGTARLGMKDQAPETLRAGDYVLVPAKHQHEGPAQAKGGAGRHGEKVAFAGTGHAAGTPPSPGRNRAWLAFAFARLTAETGGE